MNFLTHYLHIQDAPPDQHNLLFKLQLIQTGAGFSVTPFDANALLSDDFMSGATYRNGQEVAVDTASNVTAINDGTWSVDEAGKTVNFTIDLTGTTLANDTGIALHWAMTCANDTI